MPYTTKIVEVGPDAGDFLEQNMAITFAGNAPEELRPYCFLVEAATLTGDIAVGQVVRIDEQVWDITAVGEVAQQNLANLGHVTLVFDGEAAPRMPGAIHVAGTYDAPALALGAQLVFGDDK